MKLFESKPDRQFYASLFKFHTIFSVLLGVGILLLFLALLPADAYEDLFQVSRYKSASVRFGCGITFFPLGIGVTLLSVKMLKKIGARRKICMDIVQKNSISVFDNEITGCTCSLDTKSPKYWTFSVPFTDIVRVQLEKEACDIGFDNPMVDVLCLYTENRKIKVWAIADVPLLVGNINALLAQNAQKS